MALLSSSGCPVFATTRFARPVITSRKSSGQSLISTRRRVRPHARDIAGTQRRTFSPSERQQDNIWVHTTKLLQCLDLCCCFGNDVKSFPARNQCYKRSANKTFFLNHQYPNVLPVPKIEHPVSLRPRQWSKIAILANLPSRGPYWTIMATRLPTLRARRL